MFIILKPWSKACASIIWGQANSEPHAEIAPSDSGNQPEIAAVFPLCDTAYAHKMSETKHVRGEIVLQMI